MRTTAGGRVTGCRPGRLDKELLRAELDRIENRRTSTETMTSAQPLGPLASLIQ
jgi:hypothetical protein